MRPLTLDLTAFGLTVLLLLASAGVMRFAIGWAGGWQ